jgi:hypothetical protein
LKSLQGQTPAPGNDKIDNTKAAKEHHRHVRAWIDASEKYFQPIPAIPGENCTSEAFARELRRTVDTLQHEADSAGVMLPPKYDFSFSAQRPLVRFAPGSLKLLAVQLGEVKAIAETVFSARANTLDGIQRVRVSEDDLVGPAGDYIDNHAVTNDLAVITPYVVSFRCFTPELARVISAFSVAPNTFLIKAVNVQLAGTALVGSSDNNNANTSGFVPGRMPFTDPSAQPVQPVQPVAGKGGLQTVLKEQLLRVTLEVEIIKLLPKR